MSSLSAPVADHLSDLKRRRQRAVGLRLDGRPLLAIRAETGLSAPTIIAAHKAFVAGGCAVISVQGRGRIAGIGRSLTPSQEAELRDAATSCAPAAVALWNAAAVRAEALRRFGIDAIERTGQCMLERWGLDPAPCSNALAAAAVPAPWSLR